MWRLGRKTAVADAKGLGLMRMGVETVFSLLLLLLLLGDGAGRLLVLESLKQVTLGSAVGVCFVFGGALRMIVVVVVLLQGTRLGWLEASVIFLDASG